MIGKSLANKSLTRIVGMYAIVTNMAGVHSERKVCYTRTADPANALTNGQGICILKAGRSDGG